MPTLHTERGNVPLTPDESVLYCAMIEKPFSVWTRAELCELTDLSSRDLDVLVQGLRNKIQVVTGLRMFANVWGIGFRLHEPAS